MTRHPPPPPAPFLRNLPPAVLLFLSRQQLLDEFYLIAPIMMLGFPEIWFGDCSWDWNELKEVNTLSCCKYLGPDQVIQNNLSNWRFSSEFSRGIRQHACKCYKRLSNTRWQQFQRTQLKNAPGTKGCKYRTLWYIDQRILNAPWNRYKRVLDHLVIQLQEGCHVYKYGGNSFANHWTKNKKTAYSYAIVTLFVHPKLMRPSL